MNKLISRNPVLRFKLGKKIVKALYSWGPGFGLGNTAEKKKFQEVKRLHNIQKAIDNVMNTIKEITPAELGRYNRAHPIGVYGEYSPNDPDEFYRSDTLGDDFLIGLEYGNFPISMFTSDLVDDAYDITKDYKRVARVATNAVYLNMVKLAKQAILLEIDNAPEPVIGPMYNLNTDNLNTTVQNTQEKSKTTTNSTNNTSRKSVGTKSNSRKSGVSSFAKAFKEARAKGLKEFVWNGLKKNTMKAGETKDLWLKNLATVSLPTVTKTPNEIKEEAWQNAPQSLDKVYTNKIIPSINTLAPRINAVLNSKQIAEDPNVPYEIRVKAAMGLFKKGGQLPSRNPITRFRNRKFN